MLRRCISCLGDCTGKCPNRRFVPEGHCYYCMLPHRSPRNEPYHKEYDGFSCTMSGKDRILPLAWLYWEEFYQELIKCYGSEVIGTRANASKWMVTLNEGGLLNVIELVSRIQL